LALEEGEPTGPSRIKSLGELFCALYLLDGIGTGDDLPRDDSDRPSIVPPCDLACCESPRSMTEVGSCAHHLISVEGDTNHEARPDVGSSVPERCSGFKRSGWMVDLCGEASHEMVRRRTDSCSGAPTARMGTTRRKVENAQVGEEVPKR